MLLYWQCWCAAARSGSGRCAGVSEVKSSADVGGVSPVPDADVAGCFCGRRLGGGLRASCARCDGRPRYNEGDGVDAYEFEAISEDIAGPHRVLCVLYCVGCMMLHCFATGLPEVVAGLPPGTSHGAVSVFARAVWWS